MKRLLFRSIFFSLILTLRSGFLVFSQEYLPRQHYKQQVAERVVGQLVSSISTSHRAPDLKIIGSDAHSSLVAEVVQAPIRQVLLNEKAYDLCTSMGSDSLAALSFILGHELVHYFEHATSICPSFVSGNSSRAAFSAKERHKLEQEADEKGCVYSYMAGYAAHRAMPTILNKIYEAFSLDDGIQRAAGYPSRKERTEAAYATRNKLQNYLPLVEFAQTALVLGRYDLAIQSFTFLIEQKLETPSFYLMRGTAYLLKGMRALPRAGFQYPIIIETENFLENTRAETEEAQWDARQALLLASEDFEYALLKRKKYFPAQMNAAFAKILIGMPEEAVFKIKNLLGDALPNSVEVQTALGIALFQSGEQEEALEWLAKAAASDKPYALQNHAFAIARSRGYAPLQALEIAQNSIPSVNSWGSVRNPLFIDVGGLYLTDFEKEGFLDLFVPLSIKQGEMIRGRLGDEFVAGHWYKQGHGELSFVSGYVSKRLGLNQWSTFEQATSVLGKPQKVLSTANGYIADFTNASTLALFNHQNRLLRLTVYYFECLSAEGCH